MVALRLAIIFSILAGPAAAALRGPIVPPAKYDHPHPDMLIIERSLRDVDRICRAIGARASKAGNKILGCAPIGKQRCAIVVPRTHPQKAAIIRHERAHCNGWSGNHPH